ncbi:zf-HC2 domain-containing protein [Solicola gregarius]|uniref:Zf-HC2 domain-containing protein n=1 Tax=Solicola gregarius TaxID=2908642 RepID=A0AA46TJT9_9ACTN|nr:zf-HC2 domain-containing protein [Solicola gregarius]UYM06167.1 zf-HC2 domain-containing protein [Solicola gregarius]
MTHLGDRIAAFVDGQLPVDERRIAETHVASCAECRRKVREQQLLKSRMTSLGQVRAPDHLLASLSDVHRLAAAAEPSSPGWLTRCLRSSTMRALVAVSGATVTVTALAYVIGSPADAGEGEVRPPVEQFAADFNESAPAMPSSGDRIAAPSAVDTIRQVTTSSLLVDDRTDVDADDADAVRLLRDAAGQSSYLDQLVRNYRITTGTSGQIRGREAVEVRAVRGGDVAAVFWIDSATGELLRRLLYDDDGSVADSRDYGADDASSASADTGGAVDGATISPISAQTLDALAKSGWPCHDLLARDMGRVRGHWVDVGNQHVVRLTYTDGLTRLALYEQRGALDESDLDGFERHRVGGSPVWLRTGEPSIAVWSADGVVYTVVTDAAAGRLRDAVAELPHERIESGALDRVQNGLQQMGSWVAPV